MDLVLNIQTVPDFIQPGFFDIPRSFWQIKEAWLPAGQEAQSSKTEGANPNSAEVTAALWKAVWQGYLSADTWEPLRLAAIQGFRMENPLDEIKESSPVNPFLAGRIGRSGARIPRSIRERWRGGPPVRGNWFSLAGDYEDSFEDPLFEDELNRARVRLLLKRYGILFRHLLENEQKNFSWAKLLPSIRRMELSGELLAGRFFSGIDSLQFAAPGIVRNLEEAEVEQGLYWMNAADPISPCGNAILKSLYDKGNIRLPSRLSSSRICFKGSELIAVSTRNGKDLEIDPALLELSMEKSLHPELVEFIVSPKHRSVYPMEKIVIEKINGVSAASFVFAEKLKDQGFVKDRGRLVLW